MSLVLKQIFSFLKLLNSETGTTQIALGLSLGIILGFAPTLSLQTLFVFGLSFVFRIQLGAVFLSTFVFKFLAYLADPLCHEIGRLALENTSMQPLFTTLYNMPVVPLSQFNNTIVMGSAILSILLSIPMVFIFQKLIQKYRQNILEHFKNSRFYKILKTTSFYRWYHKYNELYGS